MTTPEAGQTRSRTPDVTIIIPTFHREVQLRAAIQSALDGDLPEAEIIVIDDSRDHSAEPTVREIRDDRVRYHTMPEPTGGRPALVRNVGISLARGRYLYFLDDDDQVVSGAIRRCVTALDAQPDRAVAFGKVTCFGPNPEIRDSYTRWFDWSGRAARRVRWSSWLTTGVIMFRGTLIINSCCVIRRTAALDLGGYDPTLVVYEDVDFFTRGIRQAGHVFVDTPVLRYSTGGQSIIHDLDGDTAKIHHSNQMTHSAYRQRHGSVDYRALQIVSKVMPVGRPVDASAGHRSRRFR